MDIDNIISEIYRVADDLNGGGQIAPCQQERLLEACDKLSSQLKNPEQGVGKLDFQVCCWPDDAPTRYLCSPVLVDYHHGCEDCH